MKLRTISLWRTSLCLTAPATIQNALRRHEAARVLVQSFDTLYVAIDVVWLDERFLTLLVDLRGEREAKEAEQSGKITIAEGG